MSALKVRNQQNKATDRFILPIKKLKLYLFITTLCTFHKSRWSKSSLLQDFLRHVNSEVLKVTVLQLIDLFLCLSC